MSTANGARIAAASRGEFEPAATARRLDFAMIDPPPTDSLIVFECVLEGFRTPSRRLPKNLTFGLKACWNVRPAHAPAVHRPPMLQAVGPNGDRIVGIVGRAAVVRRSSTHRVRLGVERAPAHPGSRSTRSLLDRPRTLPPRGNARCLRQAVVDMLGEARPRGEPIEIRGHRGKIGLVERRAQPAVDRQAERDIGERIVRAGDECARRAELRVQDRHVSRPAFARRANPGGIAMIRRIAHEREKRIAPGAVQRGRLPVEPLVDACPRMGLDGIQVRTAVPVRQIADDRVRFPEHEVAVHEHRHEAIRIQREEFGRLSRPESRPPIFALVCELQFRARPQHLADVDRRRLAEQFQHDESPRSTITPTIVETLTRRGQVRFDVYRPMRLAHRAREPRRAARGRSWPLLAIGGRCVPPSSRRRHQTCGTSRQRTRSQYAR
ncbi:hypothetical protein X941_5805 [Burkholderia pseudomallei MSHR5569]|nr:hypothetical protein X941_5805 [Burkholderia pseudomallei MSHR5569]